MKGKKGLIWTTLSQQLYNLRLLKSISFLSHFLWSTKALFCSSIHSSLYLDKLGYKYLAHLSLMTIYLCLWYHNKYATELRVLVYLMPSGVQWYGFWYLDMTFNFKNHEILIFLSTKWGKLSRIMYVKVKTTVKWKRAIQI